MAKALVIKGVDFSTNKLGTVTLIEEIPCVSISLSSNMLTLTNIGTTYTLTATVLPNNTTDVVSWSSSNTRIVSVSQVGAVMVKGAGTAIITATCGTKSASCLVTTTHTLVMTKNINGTIIGKGSTSGEVNAVIRAVDDNGGHYGIAYQTTKLTKKILPRYSGESGDIYPVFFSHANTLTITAPNTIRVTAVITDSTKAPDGSDAYETTAAMWLMKDTSPYDESVPLGDRVITNIPDSADSVGFCFQKPDTTGGNISLEDLASITVVAS